MLKWFNQVVSVSTSTKSRDLAASRDLPPAHFLVRTVAGFTGLVQREGLFGWTLAQQPRPLAVLLFRRAKIGDRQDFAR